MIKSVYIHIPFCKNICSYCDFCKMYYNEDLVNKYLVELEREILSKYNGEKLKTIYIGGGTPSSLNNEQLDKLIKIIQVFNLEDEYEFTIEANVSDINEVFLKKCRKANINRISIGIETTNEKFFKFLNRYNDKEEVIFKINLCKKYFDNINIDLMYSFYNQTIEDLKLDLDFFKELDVPHISIYSLILEKNTKLYIDKTKSLSEELESKMYYYIMDYLKNIGYNHYEISNFSKEGYRSIHNLTYWNNEKYYGFGLGSSGYIDNYRYTNTRSINKYLNREYLLEKEILSKENAMEEELICGLRKIEGVSITKFREKFNEDIFNVFDIESLIKKGLLVKEEDNIFIPKDKLYLSNIILINFIL